MNNNNSKPLQTITETEEEETETSKSFQDKINIILVQTNLTKEEASKKLIYFENNHILVIREWLGIPLKSHSSSLSSSSSLQNNQSSVLNINQQIFRQLRTKMNMNSIPK